MALKKIMLCTICTGLGAAAVVGTFAAAFLLYARRTSSPMLYQRGSPGEPDEEAVVILNPFRNRAIEKEGERLARALRSADCEDVLGSIQADSSVCPLLRNSGQPANLVFRKDGGRSCILVYDLPKARSRLWLVFVPGRKGWAIRSVALIQ